MFYLLTCETIEKSRDLSKIVSYLILLSSLLPYHWTVCAFFCKSKTLICDTYLLCHERKASKLASTSTVNFNHKNKISRSLITWLAITDKLAQLFDLSYYFLTFVLEETLKISTKNQHFAKHILIVLHLWIIFIFWNTEYKVAHRWIFSPSLNYPSHDWVFPHNSRVKALRV